MTDQELVEIATSFVVEAFNHNDWNKSKQALTPSALYNEVGMGREIRGADEIVHALQVWKQAMPDVKGTVTNAFAKDSMAVLEVRWEGTQTGPLDGPDGTIPASGRRQVTPSAWVFDFEGDKIAESRNYFDMYSLLKQVGAIAN